LNYRQQNRPFPLVKTLLILFFAVAASISVVSYYKYAIAPPTDALVIDQLHFNPADTLEPPQDADSSWGELFLPHDWRDAGLSGMHGWYATDLELNVPPNRLWGFYIPRITSNVLVYINDEVIGQGGRFRDPVARNWGRPLYFSIPNGVIHSGNNRIHLQVKTATGSPGYLGPVYIGPEEDLRPVYQRAYRLRVTIVESATTSLLLVAVLMAGLWLTRRKDALPFWFALMCAVWALHNVYLLVTEIPVSERAWECLRYMTLGWFSVLLVISMHRFLDLKHRAIEYSIFAIALIGSVLLCLIPGDEDFFHFVNWAWISGSLALGAYPALRVTIAWWRSWNPEYLIAMCTGLPILLAGTHDWLRIHGYIAREQGYLIQYSAPVFMLGFTIVLLIRYARSLNESEALTHTLEARVESKRLQLESNYQKMQALERERVLSGERERIMRDMHDGVGGHLVSALAMSDSHTLEPKKFKEILSNALMDLRLMIDSMDQTEGDLASVLGTLRSRLQPALEKSGIEVNWMVGDIPAIATLGPGRILQIMRILQEAITNVLKHSGARTLTVTTDKTDEIVVIDISDNGIGIMETDSKGHGLQNMRHRAKKAGIDLKIQDAKPGTRVRITIFLNGMDPQ